MRTFDKTSVREGDAQKTIVHKQFTCKRCGECCKNTPHLSSKDILRIIKGGFPKKTFTEIIGGISYMKSQDEQCLFLSKGEGGQHFCKIYDLRPQICRQYPSEKLDDCRPRKWSFDAYLERKRNGKL